MDEQRLHPDTLCVQAGYRPGNGAPRVMPICQSTTYRYESAARLGDLFDLAAEGHMYTRISNPTVACVEEKIAALEGGVGALCTSSGQAATMLAVLNLAGAGQNIVSLSSIYGGTVNLFAVTLKKLGVEVRFASQAHTDAQLDALFDENTRLVFGETIANPALTVLDIRRMSALAHRHGVPLVVDNTFATPILCRPFDFGADIVVHSTSKYMDGHAAVLGGAIVDGGRFDWAASGRYPELTGPDESYHGVVYAERFGRRAYIEKARAQLMRDMGATMQPMAAFLLNLGLETLALRMERHCANALRVAQALEGDPRVAWVEYPLLPGSAGYALAREYLPRGGDALSRRAQARRHRRARGRRAHRRAAPGQHHAPPADRRAACRLRHHARAGAPVGGHRGRRRHPGRSRPGARRLAGGLTCPSASRTACRPRARCKARTSSS